VRLRGSYLVREALPGYILHGDKGSFIKPKTDVQEQQLMEGMLPTAAAYGQEPLSQQGLLHTEVDGVVIREIYPSFTGNYMQYYESVYQSVRQGAPLPVTASEARDVIQIIEAAYQSRHTGRRIALW